MITREQDLEPDHAPVTFEANMFMGRLYGLKSQDELQAALDLLNAMPAGNA